MISIYKEFKSKLINNLNNLLEQNNKIIKYRKINIIFNKMIIIIFLDIIRYLFHI